MLNIPRYDDLPVTKDGFKSAWGLFGEDDSVGLFSLITGEVIRHALSLARRGAVFSLNAPNDFLDPPLFSRPRLQRETQLVLEGRAINEVYNDFNPQSSSQWDALAHMAFDTDAFYNGATLQDVLERQRNTIEHWARRGIVGRGVLLDLERTARSAGRPFDPGSSHGFTVEDLEAARAAAGVELRPGDVLILKTGFLHWYSALGRSERESISSREGLRACGVEHTEDMARYLWNTHAAAVASDCPSVEVWPMDHSPGLFPFGSLHKVLLGQFGMAIGELWWLEELADACASDGVHEFLLTSAPLNTPGGYGSTANALAIK